VDRYCELYFDEGLVKFQGLRKKLEEFGLLDACLVTGKFPEVWPVDFSGVEPDVLMTCTDQEQSQMTGGDWIYDPDDGLDCTGGRFRDEFHRTNNDVNASVAASGLQPAYEAAIAIFNIAYGPWQKCLFFNQILGKQATLARTLTPNSRLVLRFWPQHLRATGKLGEVDDEVAGPEGRKKWIESLGEKSKLQIKGTKVRPSQWMSFQAAADWWCPELATMGLILSAIVIDRGLLVAEEDLFEPCSYGASSFKSDGPAAKAAAKSMRAAKKEAKARMAALKNKMGSALVTAARLAADVDVVYGIRLIAQGTRAEWTQFNKMMDGFTTPEKTAAYSQWCAKSGWLRVLEETMDAFKNPVENSKSGFIVEFGAKEKKMVSATPTVRYQEALALRAGNLQDSIVEKRSGSMTLWSHYYPHKWATVLGAGAAEQEAALKDIHKDCKAVWRAQERISNNYIRFAL
jgi:hypothetical protein